MFRLTGQDAHVSADGCIVTAQDPAWPAQSFLALALPSPSILRAFLGDLLRLLAPGGTVQCALAPEVPQEHSLQLQQMLRAELVLCGFTSLAEAGAGPAWSATAVKPAWAGSSGAPLRGALLRKPTSAPAPASGGLEQGVVLVGAAVAGAGAGAAWSASGGALVDENALLAGEDFAEGRAAAGGEGGCATKRKACANCSCGRKEMETAAEAGGGGAASGVPNPKAATATSSCGNCSKGDAFRCAGCPYLGQPAFSTDASGVVTLKL